MRRFQNSTATVSWRKPSGVSAPACPQPHFTFMPNAETPQLRFSLHDSPSPQPSPAGRGRILRRLFCNQEMALLPGTLERLKMDESCSLSQRERVGVRESRSSNRCFRNHPFHRYQTRGRTRCVRHRLLQV